MNTTNSLKQLWLGQLPLREAFWRWLITYDLILNLFATIAALTLVLAEAPIILAAAVHFLPLPYSFFAATGAWRSANRYEGNPLHATGAKAIIVMWVVILLFL
ncbi:MAG: hypothetical protein Q8L53_09040 [Aestuariivirga sp.]|nr:hypothetical protein [Aestuariivirga sp.]